MISKKLNSVSSVTVSIPEFASVPIADQLQPNFDILLCVEQRITKLDWKSMMYSFAKYP